VPDLQAYTLPPSFHKNHSYLCAEKKRAGQSEPVLGVLAPKTWSRRPVILRVSLLAGVGLRWAKRQARCQGRRDPGPSRKKLSRFVAQLKSLTCPM
jgi:hypothetical protein